MHARKETRIHSELAHLVSPVGNHRLSTLPASTNPHTPLYLLLPIKKPRYCEKNSWVYVLEGGLLVPCVRALFNFNEMCLGVSSLGLTVNVLCLL